MISNIQDSAGHAVQRMEWVAKTVGEGKNFSKLADEWIQTIQQLTMSVRTDVEQISASLEHQNQFAWSIAGRTQAVESTPAEIRLDWSRTLLIASPAVSTNSTILSI